MTQGVIFKGIAGVYSVFTDDGIYECKARGKFRNEGITPTVGDKVQIQVIDTLKFIGNIEKILPRKNELIRPKVANVEQAVVVFAIKKPNPNIELLDRFLLLIEEQSIDIIICFNKLDLDSGNDFEEIKEVYANSGYKIIGTCTKTGQGIEELKECLRDKISVFAGPSGVGKSSILNEVQNSLNLKTGEISAKIERGKHTTRHAELIPLINGGYIVDSPGFTSLYVDHISLDDLQDYFKEFEPYIGKCKFNNCKHLHEPGCAIIREVGVSISKQRYERYKQIYNELEEQRRNKYD